MQSPPLGAPSPWNGNLPPLEPMTKRNGTSLLAFVASLSGFVCLVGVGGVLGIVLGLIARKEIARAEGRETGRGLATAAVALGVLNLAAVVIGMAAFITYLARPRTIAAIRAPSAVTAPSFAAPPLSPRTSRTAPSAAPPRSSRESGNTLTHVGTIEIADIGGASANLEAELDQQRSAAKSESEKLVLWLVVGECKPCDGVAVALGSGAAQKSLAKVRFVRVDRDEFQPDLERLGIPTEKIPGFALLDTENHPLDFIHGGEWDADIATNIAPVLGKFVRGTYKARRDPWHRPARADETPL